MFRTFPLSIIRSISLYTQQWCMSYKFAGSLRARKVSAKVYDVYHCLCTVKKLLLMDRGTVRNMQNFIPKINLRNKCIQLVLLYESLFCLNTTAIHKIFFGYLLRFLPNHLQANVNYREVHSVCTHVMGSLYVYICLCVSIAH